MEVLFVSNNIADWGNNPVIDSDNTKFDASRVPYAITMPRQVVIPMKTNCIAPSGDTTWFHFRGRWNTVVDAFDDGTLCTIRQADGIIIAEIDLDNALCRAKVYGDTTVTGPLQGPMGNINIHEIDIRIQVNGSGITMDYYLAQSLQSTATAANTGGLGVARSLQFISFDTSGFSMSEFVVAADDTRNVRLDRVDPSTAGNYTAWNGAVVDLADDDDTTSMFTDTATNRTSANTATYAGGDAITAVVLQARSTAGTGGPQKLTQFLRIASTDYDGTIRTLNQSIESYVENYELDPSDSNPWDTAGVNAVEVGLLAST